MRIYDVVSIYLKKSIGKKDGVAMFWQSEKVELISHQTIQLDEPVGDEAGEEECHHDHNRTYLNWMLLIWTRLQ